MKLIFSLVSFFFACHLFSQADSSIETFFTGNAYLLKEPDVSSKTVIKFKKGKSCNVIDYYGYDFWKVGYKQTEGYVESKYINLDDKLISFKNRILKKRRIKDSMINLSVKRKKDSLENVKIEKKRIKKRLDSIRTDSIIKEYKNKELLKIKERRNNCHYERNEIDQFDNILIKTTEYYLIEESSKTYIKIKKYGNSFLIYVSIDMSLGCASSYSHNKSFVKFKLENEDVITVFHTADIECSDFTLIGSISKSQINRLKVSPIKYIRLQGTEYYKDLDMISYNNFFIDKLKCVE